MKAIDMMHRVDLRRRRAEMLVGQIMRVIDDKLNEEIPRVRHDTHYALLELFMQEGIEVLSDYDRAAAGLPPRGPDGWTMDEIIAMEKYRLELLYRPLAVKVPTYDEVTKQG